MHEDFPLAIEYYVADANGFYFIEEFSHNEHQVKPVLQAAE